MSVTPGSDTLWSVHSGHFCWTSRLESSTRSWKRRSSRFGTGRAIVTALRLCGGSLGLSLAGDHVEREHEVAAIVRRPDLVADVEVEDPGVGRVEANRDVHDVDTGPPPAERPADFVRDEAGGRPVGRGEDEVVDPAAELRPHRTLAGRRAQDQPDRLLDLAFARDHRDAAGRVGPQRERPAAADELVAHARLLTR